jgi:hypothetical protein
MKPNRSVTPKSIAPFDIWALRSTTRLRSQKKSTSELPGQSRQGLCPSYER